MRSIGRPKPGNGDYRGARSDFKKQLCTCLCFALVYAGLEEIDQAFTWLSKACDERHNRLAYLKVEALWDPLRSDSRFANLLRGFAIPD